MIDGNHVGGVERPDPISCNAPAVPKKAGTACIYPKGTVAQGKRCVEVVVDGPRPDEERLQCRAPAVPNRKGTACVCPKGIIGDGKRCVEASVEVELPELQLDGLFAPDKPKE